MQAVHHAARVLQAIAVLTMSAGILLVAQSGCIGADPAGMGGGSHDAPDAGLENALGQKATEERGGGRRRC